MAWRWSALLKNYLNDETGDVLPASRRATISQQSLDAATGGTNDLAARFAAGDLSKAKFRSEMREQLKREYIRQYLLARGGRNVMTPADWGSIGGMLADQYRYLEGFVDDLDGMTEAGIKARQVARASMYVNSAREAYFRGLARGLGFDPDKLPAIPGDGSSRCLTRCNCDWEIVERLEEGDLVGWDCYWNLGPSEQHCPTCLDRSSSWAPYTITA